MSNALRVGADNFPEAVPDVVFPSTTGTVVLDSDLSLFAGGRLTPDSAIPDPLSYNKNYVTFTTIYYLPYTHNRIALISGGVWKLFTFTNPSYTMGAGTNVYDLFAYDNSGTVALEATAWRNIGQAITGATNASPIVITSNAHGLSNGDEVYINSVYGNTAANGTWTVASATTNTFALTGSTGNGTYIGRGWLTARTSGGVMTRNAGALVKASNTTRRFLGSYYQQGGNCGLDGSYLWLCNYTNPIRYVMDWTDAATHVYNVAAFRRYNNAASAQIQVLRCWPDLPSIFANVGLSNTANTTAWGFALNNATGTDEQATVNVAGYHQWGISRSFRTPLCGLQNVNLIEFGNATGTGPTFGPARLSVELTY